MNFLFVSNADSAENWSRALSDIRPDIKTQIHPDIGDPAAIDYALVWRPPPGLLASLPNLKLIFSVGAGVDGLIEDPTLPAGVPVVRMVDQGLTEGMTEYVVWQVMNRHRRAALYRQDQHARRWRPRHLRLARNRTVGVLGLGEIGCDAARMLATLRFQVLGWSRTPKSISGIDCHHGSQGLKAVASKAEILICLLPLTAETAGILNRDLFALMPRGAYLINAARGGHLVEADLLAALDDGALIGASLDVFRDEPLPQDHPFWSHPGITITPHDASLTSPASGVRSIAEAIACHEAGRPVPNVVDLERGY
ncbi:MAG: glyoxylate/hydroxypyruvate reductase A [Pseudomonadota bacterium]